MRVPLVRTPEPTPDANPHLNNRPTCRTCGALSPTAQRSTTFVIPIEVWYHGHAESSELMVWKPGLFLLFTPAASRVTGMRVIKSISYSTTPHYTTLQRNDYNEHVGKDAAGAKTPERLWNDCEEGMIIGHRCDGVATVKAPRRPGILCIPTPYLQVF